MPIRHGLVASSVGPPPTVALNAASNFNQELATLNATVDANGYSTTVKFQYSTASDFSSFTEVNAATTPITGQAVSSYANITGLSTNTTYYFRCVATNDVGTTTSSSLSFTTWNIQVYERSTSGGTTFTIPTVTPTGGSAVAVSILDIIMFGGGGGGGFGAGAGGGGYQSVSSRSMTGSRSITTSVGAGGTGDTGSGATSGGNTTLTGDLTSLTASGGNANGTSGNGNAAGGTAQFDPDGSGKGLTNTAYGGGGGAGAAGSAGTANGSTTVGGTGGTGVSITSGGVTRAGGAGGGGAAYINQGTGSQGVQGSNNTYGSGGNSTNTAGSAGQAGYIRFRYYAASALA
jgi:hypothetical protein